PASATTVTTGRLTAITDPAALPDKEKAPQAADVPPLVAHAVNVPIDPEKPLLSVVLLDDPSGQLGPAALQSLPFPVTVAVSGAAEDATARMQAYRSAGFEVVLNAELPQRAATSDIEAAFQYFFETVPQAVAVLDSSGSGFRGDRRIIDAVNTIVAESGHGLLTFDEGLNTAQQTAAAAGIPVAMVLRDLDSNGQNPSVIRRFLDQSAFNTRQDGSGIVLARVRPDTITALLIWAQQSRAQALNLVPVSAILNQ
ncbi:MAG: divergent polysaccharide deacetylase family protein, partial [Pseudomonadota bacterium]